MQTEPVRIDQDILKKIRNLARKEGRTLSGQLRLLLEQALQQKGA